nr:CAZy families GH2 protein [uncultured bacterium]
MTAWGKTQLSAKPDKKVLRANGQDLCYLPIELVGLDGITKVTEDQQIKVTVTEQGSCKHWAMQIVRRMKVILMTSTQLIW